LNAADATVVPMRNAAATVRKRKERRKRARLSEPG
jgi:hypothetical protein